MEDIDISCMTKFNPELVEGSLFIMSYKNPAYLKNKRDFYVKGKLNFVLRFNGFRLFKTP